MTSSTPRQRLVLALPSKGRLQEQCSVSSMAAASTYAASATAASMCRAWSAWMTSTSSILRPEEIPSRVEQGDAHAGITGLDLYREYGEGAPVRSVLLPKLGFGGARLVVAIPQSWVDVSHHERPRRGRHAVSSAPRQKLARRHQIYAAHPCVLLRARHRRVFARGIVRRDRGCTGFRRRGLCGRSYLDRNDAGGKSSQGNHRRHRPGNRGYA